MHAFHLPHRQDPQTEPALDKPVSVMRRAPPPMPVAPSTKPEVAMKQLHPPAMPGAAPASPPRNMKTIMSTRVAQITDPTKDGGAAEVLSLFLQQHGHSFMSSADRELQRGVMVSPDKRSKGGKEPKFIRGGLAERAQHVISGTQTNYTLWRRQMEQKLESGSTARLSPDVRFKVLKVLHILRSQDKPGARAPRAHPASSSAPRCGLALCVLVGRPKLKFNVGELADGQTYLVLLPFSPSSSAVVGAAEHLQEESEIMAWMPWQSAELEEGAALTRAPVLSDGETPEDFSRKVLVVSRFHLLPKE
ncbi:hypothetical protein CONPUDRAFT_84659 [Coniophora puteana RWD-64-598 SS2]|uniref:Uncharacterized protein n=1 Tax=Coniophora puteana (strain RWD-64-598) TaxID=741705 RepID=A0A5M3MBV7_CONPW|nr:uncharacterized protein CONPUDRAFT_84659 [Coniophora puteana RWD-64-598 SS2]EIW76712.1 hypothetical protein CONPUDRAFT_84659 [Coniophora puteana RWD-64-598 SS2]